MYQHDTYDRADGKHGTRQVSICVQQLRPGHDVPPQWELGWLSCWQQRAMMQNLLAWHMTPRTKVTYSIPRSASHPSKMGKIRRKNNYNTRGTYMYQHGGTDTNTENVGWRPKPIATRSTTPLVREKWLTGTDTYSKLALSVAAGTNRGGHTRQWPPRETADTTKR